MELPTVWSQPGSALAAGNAINVAAAAVSSPPARMLLNVVLMRARLLAVAMRGLCIGAACAWFIRLRLVPA
jgi:hypothetical protein